MFYEIKTGEDIRNFLNTTNSLHDGYLIKVQYTNNGISKADCGYRFAPEQTELCLQISVTSMAHAIVEIVFENLLEWQIKDNQWTMTDTAVVFDENLWIVWTDDVYISMEETKKSSYVIAKSMKWRILE
jgi:hypothetical protein